MDKNSFYTKKKEELKKYLIDTKENDLIGNEKLDEDIFDVEVLDIAFSYGEHRDRTEMI